MYLRGTSKINSENHLEIGGVDVMDLAKQYGTPLYVLDEKEIRNKMTQFRESFKEHHIPFQVAYASKALCTKAICHIAEEEGFLLDVVSGGELFTALNSDFPADKIHFHGNNKTYQEIEMAIENKVGSFVIDNLHEIELIETVAKNKNSKVKALIRITPGIEAHTHEYIQTGQEDSKFGFNLTEPALEAADLVGKSDWIDLKGFHFHIGSQIFDMNGFDKAIEIITEFYKTVQNVLDIQLSVLNIGGGFGIRYNEEDQPLPVKDYVKSLVTSAKYHFSRNNINLPEIWVEPGRSIVGEAGTTLYTIGSQKDIPNIRKYIAVDGGMMDNPRPALYGAKYEAAIANRMKSDDTEKVSVAGKACESGDMLIWDIELSESRSGDILAVFSTGAYNYSMASNYNRIPRPAMVLVNEGNVDLIVRRETYDDLLQYDLVPERILNYKKNLI